MFANVLDLICGGRILRSGTRTAGLCAMIYGGAICGGPRAGLCAAALSYAHGGGHDSQTDLAGAGLGYMSCIQLGLEHN